MLGRKSALMALFSVLSLLLITGVGSATRLQSASNTIEWVTNYPDTSVAGKVLVYGDYTADNANQWMLSSVEFIWVQTPNSGSTQLTTANPPGASGKAGSLGQISGQIIPAVINLTAGTYDGYLKAKFGQTTTGKNQTSYSKTVQFTVK